VGYGVKAEHPFPPPTPPGMMYEQYLLLFLRVGCRKICPEKEQPVCASNKVTYANKCEYENAACSSVDIRFVSIGPCGK
jgi:hypothetical protein